MTDETRRTLRVRLSGHQVVDEEGLWIGYVIESDEETYSLMIHGVRYLCERSEADDGRYFEAVRWEDS
jgi:hypothetical protein